MTESLFNNVFNVFLITSFSKTPTQVFSVSFTKFLRTPFLQNTSRRLLLNSLDSQKFNYASLIFLNLQLYHAPLE